MRLASHFRALVLAHIIAIVAPTGGLYTLFLYQLERNTFSNKFSTQIPYLRLLYQLKRNQVTLNTALFASVLVGN